MNTSRGKWITCLLVAAALIWQILDLWQVTSLGLHQPRPSIVRVTGDYFLLSFLLLTSGLWLASKALQKIIGGRIGLIAILSVLASVIIRRVTERDIVEVLLGLAIVIGVIVAWERELGNHFPTSNRG